MFRNLIINADDFGFSAGVNKAVSEGFRAGVILSASIMATGENFAEAAEFAKRNPSLGVGVHLNIYRGVPVSPKELIPSLIGPDGNFLGSIKKIVFGFLSGKIKKEEVDREFRAQMEKVISSGIKPSHLDSDKHLHLWPTIFPVTARLARGYSIPWIRLVKESPSLNARSIALRLLSLYNGRIVKQNGLRAIQSTLGIAKRPLSRGILVKAVTQAGNGLVEYMVHPSAEGTEKDALGGSRKQEREVLSDPTLAAEIRKAGFEIKNFNTVK